MAEFEKVSEYLALDTSSPTMLRWKTTSPNKGHCQSKAGEVAGGGICKGARYARVMIGKTNYVLSRVVWMLANKSDIPAGLVIDHIDSNTANNHPSNLQAITNRANTIKGRMCTEAVGFSWYAARKCWRVRIRVPGKSSQLDVGSFKCMLDARAAYLRKCAEVYHS